MGATLMDRWFAGRSNGAPEKGDADETDVTMKWVLGFDRAKSIYDALVAQRIWANSAAGRVIRKQLSDAGKLTTTAARFGDVSQPPRQLDPLHVQSRGVGSLSEAITSSLQGQLDDLHAALNRFEFRVAIEGDVTPHWTNTTSLGSTHYTATKNDTLLSVATKFKVSTSDLLRANRSVLCPAGQTDAAVAGKKLNIPPSNPIVDAAAVNLSVACGHPYHVVEVRKIAIYVRDSYDFNGLQPLGPWPVGPFGGMEIVTNQHFQLWRLLHGKGGDFLVYSDAVIYHRNPPDRLVL